MSYWGWRPLVIGVFMSVLVAGCTIVLEGVPSARQAPTATPLVTLTVREGAPATPSATPRPTVAISITDSPDPAPAPPLTLVPPTCTETPSRRVVCLGVLENTLSDPLAAAAVRAFLVSADGAPLEEAVVAIEQGYIPAGGFAPYRAQFNINPGSIAGTFALLDRAQILTPEDAQRYLALTLQTEALDVSERGVAAALVLANPNAVAAAAVRVTALVQDEGGRVVGWRAAQVANRLPAGASLAFTLDIPTIVPVAQPLVRVRVEARRPG